MSTFIYYYGWLAFGITVLHGIIYGIALFRRSRLYTSIKFLVFKKRRHATFYHALAKNGYIYRWSLPILIRYKAVSDE